MCSSIVLNAAAYTAVDKAESEQESAYSINHDGAANLALTCAEAGIPLIHLSTDYVFDGTQDTPYGETATAAPLGIYGASKWAGEEAIRLKLPQHVILRVSWVFGEFGNNFVKTMLRLASERPELRVVDDQRGCPTHAGAIADTIWNIADRHLAGQTLVWGTYHYTGEPATNWFHFAEAVIEEASAMGLLRHKPKILPIPSSAFPTAAKRPANSVLDGRLAHQNLGLVRREWRDGLRETLLSWKKNS